MNKISVFIFSIILVSCGSKKNLNNTNVNDMIAIAPEKKKDKVNNKKDLFSYWKKINSSPKNDTSGNQFEEFVLFYEIGKDYLKRCELSKNTHFIISNEEHKLEWLSNEEFNYTKDNKKVQYYIFKFDKKLKSMSFTENDVMFDLLKIDSSNINEDYNLLKDKCNF